ncbi:S6 family peptidase [Pantoea sp. DY-5]|uniref:S6 family peptidase n=1 Tax=Pantoea sp. DY-5 TaxID=2871488 RepID=UPI001C94F02C|nr:S6 family peptidase [Pantoea sp. DY-5]MBY4839546.1 autotransporter outer membrane beta-barrel domain-containing protein [Pantoea sp. DY-5]
MNKITALFYSALLVALPSYAGVMRHDTNVQDYRDFAENMGKFRPGISNIPIYKKNGDLSGNLNFPMPDLGGIIRGGYATLNAPSYIISVRHNTDLDRIFFGGNSEYSRHYVGISRNAIPDVIDQDYMMPRLNKVVTEASPLDLIENSELKKGHVSRYNAYARAGAGKMVQVTDDQKDVVQLAGAYSWLAGGAIDPKLVEFTKNYFYFTQLSPDNPLSTALTITGQPGDSGSPYYGYDSIDKQWKLVAVHYGSGYGEAPYPYSRESGGTLIPDGFYESIVAINTSPDVKDSNNAGAILWNATTIDQGSQQWSWKGLDKKYRHLAPAAASNAELDASKDIRFNGDGGDIILSDAVNLGAGKLQFSNNYTLKSAADVDATWVGGGVEVDKDKTVRWQVNGLKDDDLHKIGGGVLHINANGINEGGLNIGDGTVILDQQKDAQGNRQAFSRLYITSGRPTVVMNSSDQVDANNIFFGYRGGNLDLNGNSLTMKRINHTDSGATLINQNQTSLANLTLTGFSNSDIKINTWSSVDKGNIGDIYQYYNSRTARTEYFQLKKEKYWYFPTNQQDNADWKYLGYDLNEARDYRLTQLNQLVFRGDIGSVSQDKKRDKFNLRFSPVDEKYNLALTGNVDIDGNINVDNGTLLLSGQPVPHAGGLIIDDDWYASSFSANNVVVASGARFQVGEYAQVKADIQTGDNSQVILGYHPDAADEQQILRCTSTVLKSSSSCTVARRNNDELRVLPASTVEGNITLGDNAALHLGKVNYHGHINDSHSARMTLSSETFWNMNGNSRVHRLDAGKGGIISLLSADEMAWTPKLLSVEHLTANNLQLGFGIAPQSAISDSLYIGSSAQGGSNTLDLGFMLGETFPNRIAKEIVLVNAPAGTAHDYFTLPAVKRGFSLYTADHQVVEENGRVKWIIAKTPDPVLPPDPVTNPEPEPEINPEPEIKPEPEVKPEPEITPKPGTAEDWFDVIDNQPLVQSTRALLASRHYLFSEISSMLTDRAQLLRGSHEDSGAWASLSQNSGRMDSITLKDSKLEVGADTQADAWLYGVTASYSLGNARDEASVSHKLSTLGLYASGMSENGWFMDLAASYLHLRQDINLDPILGVESTSKTSHMLAGSAKLGKSFPLVDTSFTLSPYVKASAGHMPGYTLQSRDASITLSSAMPWGLTPGIEVSKQGLGALLPRVRFSATVEKQFSPGSSGSSLTLEDRHSRRVYAAMDDDRYRAHLSFEGKISDNWSANIGAKHSFGGKFRTDSLISSGINYSF